MTIENPGRGAQKEMDEGRTRGDVPPPATNGGKGIRKTRAVQKSCAITKKKEEKVRVGLGQSEKGARGKVNSKRVERKGGHASVDSTHPKTSTKVGKDKGAKSLSLWKSLSQWRWRTKATIERGMGIVRATGKRKGNPTNSRGQTGVTGRRKLQRESWRKPRRLNSCIVRLTERRKNREAGKE